MTILPLSNIISITHDAMEYKDENNTAVKVSLVECNLNWINYVNRHIDNFLHWDGSPLEPQNTETNNCVGQRNWFADKPYFEFFTEPKIKFELSPKKRFFDIFNKHWRHRYYKDFHAITEQLNIAGWTTFDLG